MPIILNYALQNAGGGSGGGAAGPSSESVTRINEVEGEFSNYRPLNPCCIQSLLLKGMWGHLQVHCGKSMCQQTL